MWSSSICARKFISKCVEAWIKQWSTRLGHRAGYISIILSRIEARRNKQHSSTHSTATTMQATTIPRFLLPQITWSPRALRPVGISSALQRCRHQSTAPQAHFNAPRTSCKTPSVPFQNALSRQWKRTPSQFSIGLSASRAFSVTAIQGRDHHFDTLKFVQRLKGEGFTEEQAEAMMRVLSDVIEERCVPQCP